MSSRTPSLFSSRSASAARVVRGPGLALALAFASAIASGACAAPEEDEGDSSNAAISTPRELEEASASRARTARLDELRVALDKAEATDFVASGPMAPNVSAYLSRAVAILREQNADPGVRAYPFAKTSRRAYVIEAKPKSNATTSREFYVYDADIDANLEYEPRPLGMCALPVGGKLLKCTTIDNGAKVPDPYARSLR